MVAAFREVANSTNPMTLADDNNDPLIPKGGTFIRWYPVSTDWDVGRNDYGLVDDRYGQAALQYRVENTCYWTWQNITQQNKGGESYGATKLMVMARTRDIFTFPCSQVRAEAGE